MAKYVYVALDAQGKKIKSSLQAENDENFMVEMKRSGYYLLRYWSADGFKGQPLSGSIPLKELSIICRQLSAMLNAGVGIVKSLDVLCQQTSKSRTRQILLSVLEEVRKGKSLHQAMADQGRAFPFYLISSVESGEESGSLDNVMRRMADYFDNQEKTMRKVRSSMMYPMILAVLCVLVVALMLIVVVPQFLTMFASQGSELPGPTKLLISITNFMVNRWWALALGIGILVGLLSLIKNYSGTRVSWDRMMLHFPVFGKLRQILVTAKFAHTMSTLSASGISMLISLEVISRVANNAYVAECIAIIIDDLRRGISLSESLRKFDIFPPMFKSMIAVGEESGELDALLEKTALFYEDEADAAVKKMVALVEPMLLVIMGIIIAFIVISILLPVYTMYQNMY